MRRIRSEGFGTANLDRVIPFILAALAITGGGAITLMIAIVQWARGRPSARLFTIGLIIVLPALYILVASVI